MISRSVLSLLVVLPFCMTALCVGQQAESVKTAVELFGDDAEMSLQSLKRILQVRSISGSFQLTGKAESFRLRLEFFRNGRRVPVVVQEAAVGGSPQRRYGRFDMQIVDLDYLKLGNAPAGHWRIFVSLMASEQPNGRGTMSFTQFDVEKTRFDAQPRTGATGRFEQFPANDDSIPLFYSASGRVKRAGSLPGLLAANPKADILVGVLETR